MLELNKIHQGDCLELGREIEPGSVDLILTDLPYGNMNTDGGRRLGINGWDMPIDPKDVYAVANRILRKNGKMVLFSQEPYTTRLINEAIPNVPFSYRAIWEKDTFANALGVNKNMVGLYEDILVFSKSHQKHDFDGTHPLRDYSRKIFNYLGIRKQDIKNRLGHQRWVHFFQFDGADNIQFRLCTEQTYNELMEVFKIETMEGFMEYSELKEIDTEYRQDLINRMNDECPSVFNLWEGNKYKSNILKYKKDYDGYHPTQKPVSLLEDLVKTFSNVGDLVVDLTCGSGSTCVASQNTGRSFIGIEKEKEYVDIANERIKKSQLMFEMG